MSKPIHDQETSILEDIEHLDYLLKCHAVWADRNLSLKESHKRIEELKIMFAITED